MSSRMTQKQNNCLYKKYDSFEKKKNSFYSMREVKFKAKEGKILYYICLGLFCLTSGAWSHEVVELDNSDEDGRGCARVTAQQDATVLLNKDGSVYFSSTDSGKHACGATNNNNFQKFAAVFAFCLRWSQMA